MSYPNKVRNFTLISKRQDLSQEEFRRYWTEVHAPIAQRLPGLIGYVQHHVVDTGARGDFPAPPADVDGIVELIFESRAAMDAALSGPVGEELVEDARNFQSQMRKYIVEDVVIVPEEDTNE
ncbi:MAG: EthD domain-containing protein [Microbacteriaceae bacterium]